MNSAYESVKDLLEQVKCTTCKGHGVCDDAEPGDIMFNKWVCKSCNGSGFKNADEYTLEEVYSE